MEIGKRVKELRKKHKMSQSDLARVLDMSRPTVSQLENGNRPLTLPEALSLVNALGISISDLSEDEKDPGLQRAKYGFDRQYFRECLLYLLISVGQLPNVGQTWIYKVLYYIDTDWFEKMGKPFFGLSYKKNEYGPTPYEFEKELKEMERLELVVTVQKDYFEYKQKRFLPTAHPAVDYFSQEERNHIDGRIKFFRDFSGRKASEYSHLDPPWIRTEYSQPINLNLIHDRPKNHRAYNRDLKIAAQL